MTLERVALVSCASIGIESKKESTRIVAPYANFVVVCHAYILPANFETWRRDKSTDAANNAEDV
jgi:hypothetical protein